jgi:hypothetical protein
VWRPRGGGSALLAQLVERRAEERVVERREHDVDALLREVGSDRLADAGARAGHERPVCLVLLLQVLHAAEIGEDLRHQVGEDAREAPEGEEVEEGLLAARAEHKADAVHCDTRRLPGAGCTRRCKNSSDRAVPASREL